jgi:ribonuclease BN (tRNA processing enzyme)
MAFAQDTRLILLGTKGGPRVGGTRANPASLVVAGGTPYVVDCGYGVTHQLIAAGYRPEQVRTVLITHHHSDHTLELGPLLYNIWVAGVHEPLDVWGPPPLRKVIDGFLASMDYDIGIRIHDEGRADLRGLIRVHEFEAPAVLFEKDGLRVRAARVHHPPLTHCYAYRFDAPDRSIVLSGDTAVCPELVTFAQGADVLLHEVMHLGGIDRLIAARPGIARLREHLLASHTTTEEVGNVAQSAGVKILVLNHLVPGDDPHLTEEMWTEAARRDFSGTVILGRDLQVI